MLEAEDIKFVFNEPVLQIGDILLMNTYHERQREKMKGCIFDHVAIYAGDAFIIEADGLGVTQSHIYSYGFKEGGHACVLRLKNGTPKQQQEIVLRVREELGKGYGVREAYNVPAYKDKEQEALSNLTFCSRLVAVAYNREGFQIVKNPYYCSPDDFLQSDLLEQVPEALQSATEEMIPTIIQTQLNRENPDTVLQEMFERYGKFYGASIQTMGDLTLEAIRHPELDDEAIRIMNEELRMFRATEETRKSWPWFDDDEQFCAHFNSIEDRLFFIMNQFLHYDKTYLPLFARNGLTASALQIYYPKSKMVARIQTGFKAVYEEAVRIRKRLADLYVMTFEQNQKAFNEFSDKYGFYRNFEYHEVITDISFIIEAALKCGFPVSDGQNIQ